MADRPVGLYWEEYEEGEVVESASRTITEAAEKLKLTRQALQYKMMKYHLNT